MRKIRNKVALRYRSADDVITTSGYRVGRKRPAGARGGPGSAVVGKPDAERTEIIKAFIVLNDGYQPAPELAEELQRHVRSRLSKHAFPREIAFVSSLSKTPSGKVQRFLLRNQEIAGSPVGGLPAEGRPATGH